jgi:hypothetical protein
LALDDIEIEDEIEEKPVGSEACDTDTDVPADDITNEPAQSSSGMPVYIFVIIGTVVPAVGAAAAVLIKKKNTNVK